MQVNNVVNALIDYCHGRENEVSAETEQLTSVAHVARFLKAHDAHAPAAGKPSRWQDVESLKTAAGFYGPPVTLEQIDEALAAALKGTTHRENPVNTLSHLGIPAANRKR